MKKVKIFHKIFIYTFAVMIFITILAHSLIYFIIPDENILVSSSEVSDSGTGGMFFSEVGMHQLVSDTIRKALPVSLICCVCVSLVVSYIFSKKISEPILSIAKATKPMKELIPDAHCTVSSWDEIGYLADNINNLYQKLLLTIKNLEEEKKKASEAEEEKINFLRFASHELKTPVTELNVTLENMLLGIGEYKDFDTYLPKCKEITEQLGLMIKDILNTSNLQIFTVPEKSELVDLGEFIIRVYEPYLSIIQSKDIDFSFEQDNSRKIFIPPKLMQKAISNIISNAVNYTDRKKKVTIKVISNILIIQNECEPIPEQQLEKVFQPFYRLDFSHSRNTGGNGLGLYIVDTIFHNLEIKYQFTPTENPKGMRFVVHYPII